MKDFRPLGALAAIVAVAVMSGPAFAGPIISNWYVIGGVGNKACSEACGASAKITETYNSITETAVFKIAITDTQANPYSAGDLVSGIVLSLNESYGSVGFDTSPPAPSAQNETLITVDSNFGPYTETMNVQTHWGVGAAASGSSCAASGSTITLETAGGCAQPAQPINMIIGQPDSSGNYSNANSSVDDGHFSPYILGTGIFWVDVTGLSGSLPPEISGVTFAFGTGPDVSLPGVPEPASLSIFLAGFGLIGGTLYARRRKSSAAGQ
jgi:hypothetical protein